MVRKLGKGKDRSCEFLACGTRNMSADEIRKETFIRTRRAASLALLLLVVPSASLAAISATDLTEGGAAGSNITSATTNSIAPGANRLILAWIVSHDNNTPIVPTTVSGNGLTWTSVTGASWNFSGGKNHDQMTLYRAMGASPTAGSVRSEEHTSELQSHHDLVCRLLLEKKKK